MLVVLYLPVSSAVHSKGERLSITEGLRLISIEITTLQFANTEYILDFWHPMKLMLLNSKWNFTGNQQHSGRGPYDAVHLSLSVGPLNILVLSTYCKPWAWDTKRRKS